MTSIAQEQILGFVLSSGKHSITECRKLLTTTHNAQATAGEIETVIREVEERFDLKINCVVTDNASSYKRARALLATKFPKMLFQPCWAHQVNLIVGDLLRFTGSIEIRTMQETSYGVQEKFVKVAFKAKTKLPQHLWYTS